MAPDDIAVEVRALTKRFRRRTIKGGYTTFKSQLVGLLTGRRREKLERMDLEVLRGLDLVIPKGRTLGIIGENGSGKSTLLKILTGIYTPTSGSAVVHGRVSALLELGAGFHPDFSGRENIFVNGIILGLSRKEIRAKLDEIIAFSELGDFIDEPVRTYSSGMFMRLAFAVATHVDPDVLIIDEILSVGDEHFGRKSRAKMEEFKASGKTIVLVTHDLGTVQSWCDLGAWIDQGKIAAVGEPAMVVAAYRRRVAEKEASANPPAAVPEPVTRLQPALTLRDLRLLDGGQPVTGALRAESALTVELDFESHSALTEAGFAVRLRRADGLLLLSTDSARESQPMAVAPRSRGTVRLSLPRLGLGPGSYLLQADAQPNPRLVSETRAIPFTVEAAAPQEGLMSPVLAWDLSITAQAGALSAVQRAAD
jgi:lipopolysaccharide transport system ATP-binding protein